MTARKPEASETRIPELPDAVRERLREVADEWLHVRRTNLTEVRKALVEILCGTWLAGRQQRFADEPATAPREKALWGIWCVEDRAWCPALAQRFEGTELEARRELEHWRSGDRADVRPGSFHYEARLIVDGITP